MLSRRDASRSGRAPELAARLGWRAHLAAHRVFEEHLDELHSEADALRTMVRAAHLRLQLVAHVRFEEQEIVPLLADEGLRSNVLRDHRLIRESLKRLEEVGLLAHFGRVDALRVRQRLVELDQLLDHHDDREERDVYDVLRSMLPKRQQASILDSFEATPLSGPLDDDHLDACVDHMTMVVLRTRYRAWLAGADLPSADAVPKSNLPPSVKTSLPKLLARDDHLVVAQRRGGPPRQRARREQLADVALRSTITVVVNGLVRAASGSA